MGKYVKKTSQRRYDERHFSIRAVHREPPDLHKLSEMLIRLTLQGSENTRARIVAPKRFPRPTENPPPPKQETSTDRRRPDHPGHRDQHSRLSLTKRQARTSVCGAGALARQLIDSDSSSHRSSSSATSPSASRSSSVWPCKPS